MSMRGKIVREAVHKLLEEWMKNGPYIDWRALEDAMGRVYDAGTVETPDQDAARWRMLVLQFGDHRAKFDGNVDFYPRMPVSFADMPPTLEVEVQRGARWRLTLGWTDRTGSADTIPKFIDRMLAQRKLEADGREPG